MNFIWYLIIFSGLLNLGLFIVLGKRYPYGVMVMLFRMIQKDPVQCKIRALDPGGPIEGVCNGICKDYALCKRMEETDS